MGFGFGLWRHSCLVRVRVGVGVRVEVRVWARIWVRVRAMATLVPASRST